MFFSSELYKKDIITAALSNIEWVKLKNKNILVTGATGLIGTFLVDVLMYRNSEFNDNITILAVGRNKEKAIIRFGEYLNSPYFKFFNTDIQDSLNLNTNIDFIIHGASKTHPIAYSTEPINTILLSVNGTESVLNLACKNNVQRTLFLSTVEIYGENQEDVDTFKENYCGYIDCNTLRAGYSEGKRAAEALCQAYIKEKNIDIVIARCSRVFGPTMGNDDSKVIAQLINNCIENKNIVLKSTGEQRYSYCYVSDVCSALIFLLLYGKNGEAYNISGDGNLSLLEIAEYLSGYTGKKIVFENPSITESAGYSKTTKALLDSTKIKELGWKPNYSLQEGLSRTIEILRSNKNNAAF